MPVPADGEWQRLDPRTVLTYPFAQGGPLVVVLLIAAVAGGAVEGLLIRLGATVGILAAFGGVHFWRFRYRLIDGRLETRSGLIGRTSKVINVDRIRGVDIEAKLAHRIAGVCALRIEHPGAAGGGRGRNRDGRDRIDAVSRAEGERLRNVLLHERAGGRARAGSRTQGARRRSRPGDAGSTPGSPSPADRVLLRMPLNAGCCTRRSRCACCFLGPAALLGVFNSLRDAGVGSGHDSTALTRGAAVPVIAAIVVVVLVVTAIVSAVVTYWHWTVTHARQRPRPDPRPADPAHRGHRTPAAARGHGARAAGRADRSGAATLQVVLSGVTGNTRSALVPLGPRAGARTVRPRVRRPLPRAAATSSPGCAACAGCAAAAAGGRRAGRCWPCSASCSAGPRPPCWR